MLTIIQFPHPTLRHKSKALRRVDAKLKLIVAEMFELMYAAKGIGLAANQVNLPFQLFVVNATGDRSTGDELVFINPVLSAPRGHVTAEEGCLSLPGVFGNVARPERIHISAYDLHGNPIERTLDGTLARVIQHEFDHIQGILFIDRMDPLDVKGIADDLTRFESQFLASRLRGDIPSDELVTRALESDEAEYCVR